MSDSKLNIKEIAGRRTLSIESDRLDEYLAAYQTGQFSALVINTAQGYKLDNIDFIANCDFVRDIEVVPGIVPLSLAPLKRLRHLRTLIISGPSTEIEISQFPELEELRCYWHPRLLANHANLRLLDVSNYKSKSQDLTQLPSFPSLRQLSLVKSDVASLVGVSKLVRLQKIELALLAKLESLHDIERLPELSWLDCDRCPALADTEEVVPRLSHLRVLRLNACSALSSLRFLEHLPVLEEFRFVGTKVDDGDLTPLTRLERVGFLRQRGLSHTPEEIDAIIAARGR